LAVANSTFIAPTSPLDKRALGKFELLCRLTAGGMSEIFLAHQKGLAGFNKLVVLKTILPDISGEEDFVRMFLDEARTTAAFSHPNIAQVYELDTDDGQLFMAMEFVQGCTLVEMARACRQAKESIPIGMTLAAVRDTALALHYAHNFTDARGRKQIVIHRDVAEKNIMVTYEGVTKLLDFGIAKAIGKQNRTTVGMVKGTSGYMSPEQIRGEPLDARSDVFSLGVVLHECLTGLRLFHGKNPEEGMIAALRESVAPASKWNARVTPDLDAVVLKALARERDARFGSALEFARAIERATPGAIWHPEQTAELMTRHFRERRLETQRLLESSFGSDLTGEFRVKSIMAQVKASQNSRASAASSPDLGPRPTTPSVTIQATNPGLVTRVLRPMEPIPKTPAEAAPALALQTGEANSQNQDAVTNLDREMLPLPGATTQQWEPLHADDEDEVKTTPALAVPDEIRALRVRVAEMAKRQEAESVATNGVTTELVDSLDLRLSRSSVSKSPSERRMTPDDTLSLPGQTIDTAEAEEGAETVSRAFAAPRETAQGTGKRRLLFAIITLSLAALMLGLLIVYDVVQWP
jgi:eukaryotic-like serine/threonine-protein kinase